MISKDKMINKDKIKIDKVVILLNFPPDKYTIAKELPKILQSNKNIIMSMIKKTNLNKKKPEHHNIYYPDSKKSHGEIYMNNKWKIKNMDEIINMIIETKTEDLSSILDEMGDIFNDDAKKRIQEVKEEFYDTKSRKMLAKHLKLLFFGKKDMIKKTRDMINKKKSIKDNNEESSEEENSEDEEIFNQKTKKKSSKKNSKNKIIESDDDDDEEEIFNQKTKKNSKNKIIESDDDDDDEIFNQKTKKIAKIKLLKAMMTMAMTVNMNAKWLNDVSDNEDKMVK